MKETNHLTVKYHGRTVGILAETKAGRGMAEAHLRIAGNG